MESDRIAKIRGLIRAVLLAFPVMWTLAANAGFTFTVGHLPGFLTHKMHFAESGFNILALDSSGYFMKQFLIFATLAPAAELHLVRCCAIVRHHCCCRRILFSLLALLQSRSASTTTLADPITLIWAAWPEAHDSITFAASLSFPPVLRSFCLIRQ